MVISSFNSVHKGIGEKKQIILVTYNPNLAVVCDAERIIHAAMDMDKMQNNKVTYCTG